LGGSGGASLLGFAESVSEAESRTSRRVGIRVDKATMDFIEHLHRKLIFMTRMLLIKSSDQKIYWFEEL
jgi:hypothetical protein